VIPRTLPQWRIQHFSKGGSISPGFFKGGSILVHCRKHFHIFNLLLFILILYLMFKGGSMEPLEPPWIRHWAPSTGRSICASFSYSGFPLAVNTAGRGKISTRKREDPVPLRTKQRNPNGVACERGYRGPMKRPKVIIKIFGRALLPTFQRNLFQRIPHNNLIHSYIMNN